MPIRNKWRAFTAEEMKRVPEVPGVYELGDAKENVLYIGSSKRSIRYRLRCHTDRRWTNRVKYFRFKKLDSWESNEPEEEEATLGNQYRRQHKGNLPPLQKRSPKKSDWSF